MNLKILNSKEKKNILKILEDQYGISQKLEYAFLVNKEGRIYIVTNEISKIILESLNVNSLGVYFGEVYEGSVRLSIEGSQIIGKIAKKNIVDLSEKELEIWVKRGDIAIEKSFEGFVIVRNGNDFYGCGKTKGEKLINYISKSRALKVLNG